MATPQELAALAAAVPAAQACQQQYKIPSSVTLAQWTFESSWGTSQLALKANNYFGIKAEHLADPSTYMEFPTAEYIAGVRTMIEADFERYPNAAASFADHGRLLATAPRYAPAMAVANDPVKFAAALQKCGYSTNPNYATELCLQMAVHKLTQYDKEKT